MPDLTRHASSPDPEESVSANRALAAEAPAVPVIADSGARAELVLVRVPLAEAVGTRFAHGGGW